MASQTFLVLEALGHPDRAAVVIALLDREGREKDLVRDLGIAQKTANRHFATLRHAGIVSRDTPHGPYRLSTHAETRAALEAVNALARRILDDRVKTDEALGRKIQRSRFNATEHADERNSGA